MSLKFVAHKVMKPLQRWHDDNGILKRAGGGYSWSKDGRSKDPTVIAERKKCLRLWEHDIS